MTLDACLQIEEIKNACLKCNEEVVKYLNKLNGEFSVALGHFVRESSPSEEVFAYSKNNFVIVHMMI